MCRSITALLFAGCLSFQLWAQASPAAPDQAPAAPAQAAPAQTPAAGPPPAGQTAAPSESSQFPLDQFQQFSAIMTGSILPLSDWDGHIYRSGKLMRMQRNDMVPSYMVSDLEKQQSHGLTANGCIKLNNLYSRAFPFFLSGPGYKYERVPVGEETVDGHLCRVEDITINAPKNPQQVKIRLWEAEDLQGFPIKIENRRENVRRWTIHYKNVVLGTQDPTLFIVPDKCQSSAGFVRPKKLPPTSKPKQAPDEKPQ
jgi:hypothetical protein